jgi:hypothetical protein
MNTVTERILEVGTRVIYQCQEFQAYHRNGQEAKVVRHGDTMKDGQRLHYIRFQDGTESGVALEEIRPIK